MKWDEILDDIPNQDSIRLTRGELLLLDWVLCSGSSLLSPITKEDVQQSVQNIELLSRIHAAKN